jgi:hypothetical protein
MSDPDLDLIFARQKADKLLVEVGIKPLSAVVIAALTRKGLSFEDAEEMAKSYWHNEMTKHEYLYLAQVLEDFLKLDREEAEAEVSKAVEKKILDAIEKKGKDWVAAAMVDGSSGYHTPSHAYALINAFLRGERESYCERCLCCYHARLDLMMYHDITAFETLERRDPGAVRRIVEYTRAGRTLPYMEQIQLGLIYPTTAR